MFVGHARHQKLKRAQVARAKPDAGAGSAVMSAPPEATTDEVLSTSDTSVPCERASQKKKLSISHGNVGSNLELTAHNLAAQSAQSAAPASPGSSPPASPRSGSGSGSERFEVESSGSSASTGRGGSKKGRSRRNSLNMNAANNSANLITTVVPRTEEQEAFLYQTVEFIRKILAEKLWLQSFMLDYYAVRSEQARKAFCRAILTVFPKPRDAMPLIRQAIAVEVSTTEDASLLMREGSIMVDLLRVFFLTVGKEQVAAIGPLIKELVRNQVPMEVDPVLLDSNKEKSLEQNRLNLISMTQKFLDKIHAAMLSCSRQLKEMLRYLYKQVKESVPGSQFRALGSLVYLRIFCPAIVSPHSFDLVKQPVQKEVRRHLLLIAKLIQGLANEAEFEKEPYMTPFNWFVTDTIETMNTRYLAWIEPPAAVKEVKQKGAKEKSWDYKPDLRNSPETLSLLASMGEVLPVARGTFAFASESFRTIETLQLLYAQCQDIFPFHAGSVVDPAPADGARSRSIDASDVVSGGPEKASQLQRVRV